MQKFHATKAHHKYALKDGTLVPGVTTVIDVLGLNKGALIGWTRKQALAGIDPTKVRDKAADVGTIAHFMIECHLQNDEPDLSEFAPADVEKAENCFINFLDWQKNHNLVVYHTERQMISEMWRYGGTADLCGEVNGELAIVDYKSSKAIYKEMKIQGAALAQLWMENDPKRRMPSFYVLQLGQTDGAFHYAKIKELGKFWEMFYHALEIYRLNRETEA